MDIMKNSRTSDKVKISSIKAGQSTKINQKHIADIKLPSGEIHKDSKFFTQFDRGAIC